MHLITGARSGLGHFLQKKLQGIGFTRQDLLEDIKKRTDTPFESIIHCAFNVGKDVHSANLAQYVSDNLLLTQKLLDIPHKKFIFISSSDVYPRNAQQWKEEDEFPIDQVEGLYGLSKLMCEKMIQLQSSNCLILRPTALLGIHSRPNSLIKILNGTQIQLTLDAKSSFNYVLHEDVLQFIQQALVNNIQGVFNLAANSNVTLEAVSARFEKMVHFGSYVYKVANLNNEKAAVLCPTFSHSSLENIERFCVLSDFQEKK